MRASMRERLVEFEPMGHQWLLFLSDHGIRTKCDVYNVNGANNLRCPCEKDCESGFLAKVHFTVRYET